MDPLSPPPPFPSAPRPLDNEPVTARSLSLLSALPTAVAKHHSSRARGAALQPKPSPPTSSACGATSRQPPRAVAAALSPSSFRPASNLLCCAPAPSARSPRALLLAFAYTVAVALLALWALSAPPSALCALPLASISPSSLLSPPRLPAAGSDRADGAEGEGARRHGGEAGLAEEVGRNQGDAGDGSEAAAAVDGGGGRHVEAEGQGAEQQGAEQVGGQASARFFLYRLIGNDMAPLQCDGQLLWNTLYALQHEARQLRECRRLWVLNNIVNGTQRALLVDALLAYGVKEEDILIRRVNFSHVATLPESSWTEAVTAQNEARNFILDHGRAAGARWILAFDGNQFITAEAWDTILQAANRHEAAGLKVFKVPMYRVHEEQSPRWLAARTRFPLLQRFAPQMWESQVAFRNDSDYRYKEGMAYGKDNKLELIDRVCGTGRFEQEGQRLRKQQRQKKQDRNKKHGGQKEQREAQRQAGGMRQLLQVDSPGGRSVGGSESPLITGPAGAGVGQSGGVWRRRLEQRGMEGPPADTGKCGCHREVGRDHRIKEADAAVALKCGYTVRLWYFPCAAVDAARIFVDKRYRAGLREKGYSLLAKQIKDSVEHAMHTQ